MNQDNEREGNEDDRDDVDRLIDEEDVHDMYEDDGDRKETIMMMIMMMKMMVIEHMIMVN
jgi:hypothetical protein